MPVVGFDHRRGGHQRGQPDSRGLKVIRKVHNTADILRDKIRKLDKRILDIGAEIHSDVALDADIGLTLSRMVTRDLLSRKRIRIVDNLRDLDGSGPDCGRVFNLDCPCPECRRPTVHTIIAGIVD